MGRFCHHQRRIDPKVKALVYVAVFAVKSEIAIWKTKPSWFIQANSDKAITPQVQSFMAKRAKSKITEIDASHLPMLSQSGLVTRIIEEAATSIK